MSVLIKNGRIVTAADDYAADIFINSSQVDLIGRNLNIDMVRRDWSASGKRSSTL